jgi:hypothetical protein
VKSQRASPDPDGLERIAEDSGFLGRAIDPISNLLPDYTIPLIGNSTLSGIVAVVLGTLVVFGLMWWVGRSLIGAKASS